MEKLYHIGIDLHKKNMQVAVLIPNFPIVK